MMIWKKSINLKLHRLIKTFNITINNVSSEEKIQKVKTQTLEGQKTEE